MYITLFLIILIFGLLFLFVPYNIIRKWTERKVILIILRAIGAVLIIISVTSIYALLSGIIVLPLIK